MIDAIAQALSDLDRARDACLAALDDRHLLGVDKLKAAAELRLIQKERLALLDRQAEAEADRRDRADSTGLWNG